MFTKIRSHLLSDGRDNMERLGEFSGIIEIFYIVLGICESRHMLFMEWHTEGLSFPINVKL